MCIPTCAERWEGLSHLAGLGSLLWLRTPGLGSDGRDEDINDPTHDGTFPSYADLPPQVALLPSATVQGNMCPGLPNSPGKVYGSVDKGLTQL